MLANIPEVFPFLKKERHGKFPSHGLADSSLQPPSVKLSTDRPAYRPGDTLLATIEVSRDVKSSSHYSSAEFLLLENLVVEIKGIEKLDPQWLLTPEPARGSKQRRGERTILESSPTAIVSDVLFEQGAKRTYLVRTVLPKVLPPSYKGTVARYLYYLVIGLQWSISVVENGHSGHLSPKTSLSPVEVRTFLNIWTMPTNSGLTIEEPQTEDYWGIVPQSAVQVEIYWKEKNDENDWARASDVLSEIEDETASQSTESALQSPEKGSLVMSFERLIQLQSPALTPRAVSKKSLFRKPGVSGLGSLKKPTLLTVSTIADSDGEEGFQSRDGQVSERRAPLRGKGSIEIWPNSNYMLADNDVHENFGSGNHGSGNHEHEFGSALPRSPSGTYARGRSYNIRFDDQVLARFSPRNLDSTYYFGDVVGGVLSFFHDEGSRRCLEISAVLETREVLNPSFIHPSRKNSPVITKVQSDYYEAVADMLQTHFVFSIPFDGPPSFTTPQVSLQWVLRFEFVITPRNIDRTRYEHPLLIEEREKGEWSIPILVHAPLPRTQKAKVRSERPSSPRRESWGDPANLAGRIPPLSLPPSSEKFLSREHLASSSFDSM